jgi:murein DD-endopeptidase MepM/ murein hydrolase activator NlpD
VRRIVTIVAAVALVPVVAWTAASAGTEPPVDCTAPTTVPTSDCVAPAPAAPVDPVAPTTTSVPTTPGPTTTTPGSTTPPPTSVDPSAPPTTPGSGVTTTTTPTDSTTTTTPDPNATTTTLDPNTTTTLDPNATTTTLDPNTTTTTVPPPPPEDLDSDPVAPPVEAPNGVIVVPSGAVESGQLRAITFPVAGPISYVNDWGACRDGCNRAHKGNDLIGDRRQPVLAMHDGVIDHLIDHPTAGFGVAIRDDEGWEYHVYHMNNDSPGTDDGAEDGTWRFLPGIVAGARVTAGQQIGWMGDSGNSEGSVPHAHVEIHTPQGSAINPYWSLRAAQRAVNCAVGVVGLPEPVPSLGPALAAAAAPPVDAAPPVLATTTMAAATPLSVGWWETGWTTAALPAGWAPFTVTGGHPTTADVAARFWISPLGYTPVDAAAARVGDPRYDEGVDCSTAATAAGAPIPAELAIILATIRHMETGGDYTVSVTTSTASGAYGFLDSSWGGYGGYARAKDAPPPVQDAKAAELATYILDRNGGDVSTIPVSWYIGHVPVGDEWDIVPRPDAGNRITPREYQRRWLNKYGELIGNPAAAASAGQPSMVTVDTSATCRTVVVDVGTAPAPQYALTQAQSFLVDGAGRAVPDAVDPCDPGRALTAAPLPPPPDAAGAPLPSPDLAAKLEDPVVIATTGLR